MAVTFNARTTRKVAAANFRRSFRLYTPQPQQAVHAAIEEIRARNFALLRRPVHDMVGVVI